MNKENFFAEIISSSLDNWQAQCWQWDKMPDFGSIVVTECENRKIFAVVNHIQSGSIDPQRQTFAYQKTHEELMQEQPQIFEFLKTSFSCIVLGYIQSNKAIHSLAPKPAKLHSFISFAKQDDLKLFFVSSNFLYLLFNHSNKLSNFDDLLLALTNNLKIIAAINDEQIDSLLEIYGQMNVNDYRKLRLFINRLGA